MAWFSTIFYRNRRLVSFALAIVLFALVIFSPDRIRPFIGNASSTVLLYPFSKLRDYVVERSSVAEENKQLRRQIAELSLQLSARAEAIRENSRLREFLGFEPPKDFRVEPVKIVSLVQNIYPLAAVINKGGSDSILIDQPIINRFGLVGKVTQVMPDFANVTLLTDPSNPVSGRIADSRQIGIVRFSPEMGMYFDNLPADALINPGDMIITSGLGGVYPAGLWIAIVDSARADRGDILKTVWLRPAVNFFEIDELYVLITEKK